MVWHCPGPRTVYILNENIYRVHRYCPVVSSLHFKMMRMSERDFTTGTTISVDDVEVHRVDFILGLFDTHTALLAESVCVWHEAVAVAE